MCLAVSSMQTKNRGNGGRLPINQLEQLIYSKSSQFYFELIAVLIFSLLSK